MIWQLFYLAIDITKYDTVKNFCQRYILSFIQHIFIGETFKLFQGHRSSDERAGEDHRGDEGQDEHS